MQGLSVTAMMILAQISEVGLNTMFKAATTSGMSNFVYIVYSNALALCVLLPTTFLYHRFLFLDKFYQNFEFFFFSKCFYSIIAGKINMVMNWVLCQMAGTFLFDVFVRVLS